MAKNTEYSELIYDDFSLKYKSTSYKQPKLFSLNNLIILLLFTFIDISSQTNSTLKHESYFDAKSQIYHLAENHYRSYIDQNYQKLNGTMLFCFTAGTNWNQSFTEGRCVCKFGYTLLDCGLNDQVKNKLLRKQSNCHFEQDYVNIQRSRVPSKIIFTMPLINCHLKDCYKFIDELVKEYENIVDLFIFLEVRTNETNQQQFNKQNLIYNHHLKTSINNQLFTLDNEQNLIKLNNTINQTNNQQKIYKNILYQIKLFDLNNKDEREINSIIYGDLLNLISKNVANFRSNDRILFLPPFNKVYKDFLFFFKFYKNFGEPIALVDNFYTKQLRRRFINKEAKLIHDDLNSMRRSVMLTFQFLKNVCEFNFNNFYNNYCLNNHYLVKQFEHNFWKTCNLKVNALIDEFNN